MKRTLLFLSSFLFILTLHAQPGTLDPSFADGGKLVQKPQTSYLPSSPVVIQNDGKILSGSIGTYNEGFGFRVTRYLTDGSLDQSFGTQGIAITPIYHNEIPAMALQKDDKIIAVQGGFDITLFRFNANGTQDSTFGTNGTLILPISNTTGNVNFDITTMLVQPNGNLVFGGSEGKSDQFGNTTSVTFVVFRSLPDGTLDENFGNNGRKISKRGISIQSLALQPDGKILVGGFSADYRFYMERYLPDGTTDKAFGDNGGVETDFEGLQQSQINGIALQQDGKILATGAITSKRFPDLLLARYDNMGKLDNTFNDSGKVINTFQVKNKGAEGVAVLLQSDNKIIVAGNSIDKFTSGSSDFAVTCYNPDGSLNKEFGNNGLQITDMGGSDVVSAAALQPDGKIVVSGISYNTTYAVALARYNTSQSAVLPLALTQFSAMQNERGVALNWQTATETNTNYFSVQRSIPNSGYAEIAKVKSIGYSTAPHNYTYIDNAPAAGANTYQLKVVDKDGTATYSKAASINYTIGKILKLYPNPAHNTVTVEGLDAGATTTISLLDARGKIVKQQVSSSSAKNAVSIANLAAGTYYLKAESISNTTTIKFVKE